MAARLFRPEDQPKLPADRRMDPHSARYCGHPGDLEPLARHLVPCFDDQTGSVEADDLFILPVRKAIWPPGRMTGWPELLAGIDSRPGRESYRKPARAALPGDYFFSKEEN